MSSTATARRLFATRPITRALLDVAVAVLALAGSLSQLAHGGVPPAQLGRAELDMTSAALAVCSTAPLIAWRASPLGVYVVTTAASVLIAALDYPLGLLLGPAAAVFLLAASRDQQAPWTRRVTATVVGMQAAYLAAAAAAGGGFPSDELLHTGLAVAGGWFAGDRTRLRREQVAELRQRAQRAERDAQRDQQLAVAEERARIARDLHDSAGHAMSLIAVRAGAARLRASHDPKIAVPALATVEELARQTVEEIDQIVRGLREGDPAASPARAPLGLASLDTLVAHHTATGLTVRVTVAGEPRDLAGAADQAAYRILQEALANAARHGAGDVTVNLTYLQGTVELTVTNPVAAASRPRPGGGHGLIGMRERATLLGGSLEIDRADNTFRVRARIPHGGRRT